MKNIDIIYISILILPILVSTANASTIPIEEWNKTFDDMLYANSALQILDSGYIIIGYSDISGSSGIDSWLIKTDINGNKLWSKKIGKSGDFAKYIQQIPNEGYIIAGNEYYQDNIGTYSSGWLIKTDINGNELWNKTYRMPSSYAYSSDYIYSVYITSDNGYILAGQTTSPDISTNGGAISLIKTDNFGNELWNKTYGIKTNYTGATYSEQTIDGGYIIGGFSYGLTDDAVIIKTDSNGNEIWNKSFKGLNQVRTIKQTLDRGYIITGIYYYPGKSDDGWIIKADINGEESWSRTYGSNDPDGFWSIEQTKDRGYVAVGFTGYTGAEGWLVKINENGNDMWNKTFGTWTNLKSVKQTSDGGYILSGMTEQNQEITRICCEAWLVKISNDNIGPVHNINKGTDYITIQSAIDDANIGDEIHVDSGTYLENININKMLILKGIDTGGGKPFIKAFDSTGNTILVDVDGVNINGFKISGAIGNPDQGIWKAGIYVYYANYVNISGNIIENSSYGIFLYHSNNDILDNNDVSNNYWGIWLSNSNNNILENNIANYNKEPNNAYGIYLGVSDNNILRNNIVNSNNNRGINLVTSNYNLLENNTVNSNKGIFHNNFEAGIYLESANNNELINNHADHNSAYGIALAILSNNNILRGNDISSNDFAGIGLGSSSNNVLDNNIINDNYRFGLYIDNYNFYLSNSEHNIIYNNYFNNHDNFLFNSINDNTWNTTKTDGTNIIEGPYIGGNFWAKPDGTGFSQSCINRGDGFCNSSYTIDPNNTDYLPLTNSPISICGNTPEGQNIRTFPTTNINMIFNFVTQCGNTTASVSDNQWGPFPDNYNHIKIYNIRTTASYTNSITINISYLDSDIPPEINESSIKLFHYENGDWIDITTFLDTNSKTITGITTSLSPFSIAGEVTVTPTVTPIVTPTISPTITTIMNTIKGPSSNYIGIIILSICLMIISILILRKR